MAQLIRRPFTTGHIPRCGWLAGAHTSAISVVTTVAPAAMPRKAATIRRSLQTIASCWPML